VGTHLPADESAGEDGDKDQQDRSGLCFCAGRSHASLLERRRILDDLRRLPLNERLRAELALPFPGPYQGTVGNRLEPYFLIGFESLQNGSYGDAMSFFEQCLRIDPGISAIHSNIGAIHARLGRIEESLTSYRKAAQLDPGSADIQFNMGTTLAMARRFQEAVTALERATQMDPAAAESWANLGNAYLDLDKPDLARAPLERALELRPSPVIHNSLGTLHFQQGALELARKYFEDSIRLDAAYEPAYLNLGPVYLRLGDRPRAAADPDDTACLETASPRRVAITKVTVSSPPDQWRSLLSGVMRGPMGIYPARPAGEHSRACP
jgi:tetratricopeptide (TPR) repeat protein